MHMLIRHLPAPLVPLKRNGEKKPAWLFLVRKDRLPILAVEVMAIYNKSRTKLRTSYTKNGVPYIRFYHDVDVWWNTKSYIRERALQAVK